MTCNVEPKEFLGGLNSLRRAKNVLCLLFALAVLLQIAAFVLVNWINVIDLAPQVSLLIKGDGEVGLYGFTNASVWYDALMWGLPFARIVAVVCAVLIVVMMMFASALSLIGGQGGIKYFFNAFFWSLLLLGAVLPWQMIIRGSLVAGVMYNLGELICWSQNSIEPWASQGVSAWRLVPYYARFLAYPILTLMIWIVVQVKFAGGFRIVAANVAQCGQIETPDAMPPASENEIN